MTMAGALFNLCKLIVLNFGIHYLVIMTIHKGGDAGERRVPTFVTGTLSIKLTQ